MQIQKGLVKYKDRSDIVCTYGTTDSGQMYYFLDGEKLNNGYIIASTALVEAIDPLIVASSIGVIDSEGNEIIPFINKSIKVIADNVLLVEGAQPTTQSVLDAINLRRDPLAATKLVSTSATIKEQMYAKMGPAGKFVFNDQFSEAMICDLEGHNLMGEEKYSFIGVADNKIYLSKNIADGPIEEYSIGVETKEEVLPETGDINIQDALISKDVIDSVMENNTEGDVTTLDEEKVDEPVETVENVEQEENTEDSAANEIDSLVTEVPEEETISDVNPIVPNVISMENDFEDDSEGSEKSKTDDKDGFSLFDNNDNNLDDTIKLDLPVVSNESNEDYKESTFDGGMDKDIDDFNTDISFDSEDRGKDTVFDEAVVVINKMIGQIEEQRNTIASYEEKLEKLTAFRERAYDENKKLVRKYEMLLQEYKKLQLDLSRKNDMIDSQRKEISKMKQQISSKKDLARLLEKAQNVFDEGYDAGYSKVKSI